MSIKLIKALLNKEFYDKYKHKLSKDFFTYDANVKGLFSTLEKAYETIEQDLTPDSLKELHYTYNPTITAANRKVLDSVFTDLAKLDLTKETTEVVLKQAIEQFLWTELANIGIQGGDGLDTDFLRAQEILDNIREGISLATNIKDVKGTVKELLAATANRQKWKFHIPTLARRLEGLGEGTFTLVAARPNAGKTAFVVSILSQPQGFLDQGARVVYIGNEESVSATRLRAISCYSGSNRDILESSDEAATKADELFAKIDSNLTTLDIADYTFEELQKYCQDNHGKMDVLVVDQLDNLELSGTYQNKADKLEALYTASRQLSKKHNIAMIGVCQASALAENKAVFGMDCLNNSKTGKAGALDVCLCIGRRIDGEERDVGNRTLNIAKNKLTGIEDHITYVIDFPTSRIRA